MGLDHLGNFLAPDLRGLLPLHEVLEEERMKRINDNTVEYTDRERIIVEIHEMLVDQGHSPGMALLIIRGAMLPPPRGSQLHPRP